MFKRITMVLIGSSLLFAACTTEEKNPFLTDWDTPFGTPPFDKIKTEHYPPAYETALKAQNEEINAIVNNQTEPTFENTIVALDQTGELLNKVSRVFGAMISAMSNEELQKIAKDISPKITKHKDDINLNEDLFKRVKAVYEKKESLGLNTEQNKLLDKYYKTFVRGGINLEDKAKKEFRKINEEIALLTLNFGENILKETNKFELVVDNEEDLDGLPESSIAGAFETAKEKGYEGKWVFTIHKPSMIPFLQYSAKRDLREKIYRAYFMKGDNGDELDNKQIINKLINLRLKRANILGYKNHAEYVLEEQMASKPEKVYDLLDTLWEPALKRAIVEKEDMQQLIYDEGYNFETTYSTDKKPRLSSGTLNPGGKVRGWLTFEVPENSKQFKLQFTPNFWDNDNLEVQLY